MLYELSYVFVGAVFSWQIIDAYVFWRVRRYQKKFGVPKPRYWWVANSGTMILKDMITDLEKKKI